VNILGQLKKNHVYGEVGKVWPKLDFQKFSKYPKQPHTDFYNCGVYVLYFAECILKNKFENVKFNEAFCPIVYREVLKDLLLEESDFMRDICLCCGRTDKQHRHIEEDNVDWVQCDACNRWIIVQCVKDAEQILDIDGNFECLLCISYSKRLQSKY